MEFKLEIACDNAAFEDDHMAEVASILEKVKIRLERGDTSGHCMDHNGNVVGQFWFAPTGRYNMDGTV